MLVRTLTLQKSFANTPHSPRWWALIGHFDEMECSDIEPMSLENINALSTRLCCRDSEDSYHHVIFLIHKGIHLQDADEDQAFWNTGLDFLSITRIHFPETTHLRQQFDAICDHLRQLSSTPEYARISWRAYYTIELSDMVLVSRSASLQALSRWSMYATQTPLVGSAYTYFAIPGLWIDQADRALPSELNQDTIDFLSIRLSLQGRSGDKLLNLTRASLGECCTSPFFRIAGNEDAIICGNDVPSGNLIRLYRAWYSNGVLSAFRDRITRLGTDWKFTSLPPESGDFRKPRETKLEKFSRVVLDKVRSQVPKIQDIQTAQWLRPLITLTNTMTHMSQSATLDGPVFLILPALNAFWDNVLEFTSRPYPQETFQTFAELCNHTMEHLMRAEGQLSHRPETRPMSYDIPVFILEYATSFLLSLRDSLTIMDNKSSAKIRFLLVPSASPHVRTCELFRASGCTPGLLQTTVPFSMLYQPKYLLPSLCHEMAHYVGEAPRLRQARYDCFLHSTAQAMGFYFFDRICGKFSGFYDYLVHEFLDKSLREEAKQSAPGTDSAISNTNLEDLLWYIRVCAERLVSAQYPDAYANLIRGYLSNSSYSGAQVYSLPELVLQDHRSDFFSRMDDLMTYYHECYADLCMLRFLRLSPLDYLNVALPRYGSPTDAIVFQAYACMTVSGCSFTEILNAFEAWGSALGIDGATRDHVRSALEQQKNLSEDTTDEHAEQYVIQYLRKCWAYFSEINLGTKPAAAQYTTRDIYNKLLDIDNGVPYSDIWDIIDQGRQAILEDLSGTLL